MSNLEAVLRYRQTEKGKEVYLKALKRYQQSEKCKSTRKHYQQSVNFKIAQKLYCIRHPNRRKAMYAVNNAIASDKLPKANTLQCSCGKQAQQYHHHNYEPEYWFDIVPVCKKCHRKIHQKVA